MFVEELKVAASPRPLGPLILQKASTIPTQPCSVITPSKEVVTAFTKPTNVQAENSARKMLWPITNAPKALVLLMGHGSKLRFALYRSSMVTVVA